MSEFIRPQVTVENVSSSFARFTVEPLEHGFGNTLGNSLRRVLLSSLDGAAVQSIHIDGVQHEFQALKGVREDVTDIVLNVKNLVFRPNEQAEDVHLTVDLSGPTVVTGEDFFVPSEYELMNPELVIAHLEEGAHLTMSMRVGRGRGYVPAENNERMDDSLGVIHVDSLYSPVRRCTQMVQPCRVGQRTDYDSLVLEIETNGAIAPAEALVRAANIVTQHMSAFASLTTPAEAPEEPSIFAAVEEEDNLELGKRIDDLDLSVRSFNCLKRAGIHSVRQLLDFSEEDLLNIRNFGVKSIEEVKEKLASMGMGLKQ